MAARRRPRWVAFAFPDPMCSPRIKQDEDLASLLTYLAERGHRPGVYGPVIYFRPVVDGELVDLRRNVLPVGVWEGGMKIRLCEGVEEPPLQGIEFVSPIQFIDERISNGREEETTVDRGEEATVRDDGPSAR